MHAGTPAIAVCRKLGVSEQTFYRWKRQFAGLGMVELPRLCQVEEENRVPGGALELREFEENDFEPMV